MAEKKPKPEKKTRNRRKFDVWETVQCPTCRGSGTRGGGARTCGLCKGKGTIRALK